MLKICKLCFHLMQLVVSMFAKNVHIALVYFAVHLNVDWGIGVYMNGRIRSLLLFLAKTVLPFVLSLTGYHAGYYAGKKFTAWRERCAIERIQAMGSVFRSPAA